MPRLQEEKYCRTVCTVDNKIFVFGGSGLTSSCEMLDLGDDDPHWKYIANTNNVIDDGVAVAIDKKIYVLGGELTDVEEYDVDQGILMEYFQIIIFDIYRSVEHC